MANTDIQISIQNVGIIDENAHCISQKVSFLGNLDLLHKYNLYATSVSNVLCYYQMNVKLNLIWKKGHKFLTWNREILLSTNPFHIRLKMEKIFGEELFQIFMVLDRRPVPHVINAATLSSDTVFIDSAGKAYG